MVAQYVTESATLYITGTPFKLTPTTSHTKNQSHSSQIFNPLRMTDFAEIKKERHGDLEAGIAE
jgi:hypothetical protein